jgi:hypothetical protein
MLESSARDFKHAARGLVRAPVFTIVIMLTLALAIGANTAIFSVAKVVLLEPLPFPNADRLVHIGGTAPGSELGRRVQERLWAALRPMRGSWSFTVL